ncbi:cysteine desulfurase [Candidatus Pacearchaeota archaeon]|nr:cysteine desulfurase [Candidatus Pacearchaeota archaeon]
MVLERMKSIYLDNAATTPVRKEVANVMTDVMSKHFGNPSSPHALGDEALELITRARKRIASLMHAKPEEIVFTSGATEANALALFGLAGVYGTKKRIVISAFEHSSIREVCAMLQGGGYEIVELPVTQEGLLDIKALEQALTPSTLAVSLIHGHNELGTIQDIKAIASLCKQKNIFFHTDAVQSYGKVPIDVRWGIALLSVSAHKLGGPKGIGCLYVREGIHLKPLLPGSQERGRRGGTENVPGIVGFEKAVALAQKNDWGTIEKLRTWFEKELEGLGGVITCKQSPRLPGHVHVSFPEQDAEQLVIALSEQGIYCSARSACLTKQHTEHKVLDAIGMPQKLQKGSVRFVLGAETSKKELKVVVSVLTRLLS